jgi:hypothetical protein
MGTSKQSRITVTATNKQLETGLDKHFPNGTFGLLGKKWKTVDLVATLEKEDTLIAAASNARGAYLAATSAARAQTTQNNQLRIELKAVLIGMLGATNAAELADFGITVRPRKQRSGAISVAAAQKATATRLARGTRGPKARLAIHGVVATMPAPAAQPVASPAGTVTAVAANPASTATTLK